MSIRVLIAEDERLAREELMYLLKQEEDLVILPSAANGRELLELVEEHDPDVVFLDINMPDIGGIQAARMLAARRKKPLVVFSTAHEEYAIEAFDLNAVDYLLKPYDHHRLMATLDRIRSRMEQNKDFSAKEKQHPQKITKLLIDDGDRLVVIAPETILYAARQERLIEIVTLTKPYKSKLTLQQLEEKLAGYAFFRTHRSYLVNTNYVLELIPWFNGTYNVVLNDDKRTQIPVSRSASRDLLTLLQG